MISRSLMASIFNASIIAWTFCYLIACFVAAKGCYYIEDRSDGVYVAGSSDCYEGDGWARVMSVGPEKSFQSIVIGLATGIHACYLLYTVKNGKADTTTLDKLEGMAWMICLMLLITAVFWGTQDLTEEEFIHHGNATEGSDAAGKGGIRHYVPNKALLSTFAAQTVFSTFALLSELGVLYALTFWKDELIADSGSGFAGFDNFSSGGASPAPYNAASEQPSHYSDL